MHFIYLLILIILLFYIFHTFLFNDTKEHMGSITVESNEAIQIMAKMLNTGNATVSNLTVTQNINSGDTITSNNKLAARGSDGGVQFYDRQTQDKNYEWLSQNGVANLYSSFNGKYPTSIDSDGNINTSGGIKGNTLKLNNNSTDDKDSTYFFDANGNNEIKRPTNFSDPVNMMKGAGVYGGLYCNGGGGILTDYVSVLGNIKLQNNSKDDNLATYFPHPDGNNYIRGPTTFDGGTVTHNSPVNMLKGAGTYGGAYFNGGILTDTINVISPSMNFNKNNPWGPIYFKLTNENLGGSCISIGTDNKTLLKDINSNDDNVYWYWYGKRLINKTGLCLTDIGTGGPASCTPYDPSNQAQIWNTAEPGGPTDYFGSSRFRLWNSKTNNPLWGYGGNLNTDARGDQNPDYRDWWFHVVVV
jgi:hypothetical protein